MGDKITLNIQPRELHGKKVAKLRKEGLTPGVVYGADVEAYSVQVESREAVKVVRAAGKNTPVHLTGAKKRIAMIKDIDMDPVRHEIRHISFHAVKANEPVVADIPIRLVGQGESEAEKAGLIVLQSLDKIEVKALPMDLPESFEVSIVGLKEEGERLTVADVEVPKGVEIIDNVDEGHDGEEDERQTIMDLVIASVYEPAALEAANEAAGGDAEDESEVESEHGDDTPQEGVQDEESRPGGKGQDEPKQSNVDANK